MTTKNIDNEFVFTSHEVVRNFLDSNLIILSFLYVCMVNTIYLLSFVETIYVVFPQSLTSILNYFVYMHIK